MKGDMFQHGRTSKTLPYMKEASLKDPVLHDSISMKSPESINVQIYERN